MKTKQATIYDTKEGTIPVSTVLHYKDTSIPDDLIIVNINPKKDIVNQIYDTVESNKTSGKEVESYPIIMILIKEVDQKLIK